MGLLKKFLVYDGMNNKLLDDDIIIEAKTGKDAIQKLLKDTKRDFNIKRSRDNDVVFKAQAFSENNGRRYKEGNAVWYKITR